jgi:hypothetical protein
MLKVRAARSVVPLLLALAVPLGAANVDIPSMELYTRGTLDSGSVDLQTEGELELAVRGGVKFGGEITLGFVSPQLEQSITDRLISEQLMIPSTGGVALTFRSASVIIRDLFSLPLSFTYFVGESDELGSGTQFPQAFGIRPVATEYRGFLYFPESARYDSIHTVAGTGTKIAYSPQDSSFQVALFAYQDGYFYQTIAGPPVSYEFDPGRYSVDVHSLANLGKIHLEAFAGATLPSSALGYYRGGLLFHAADVGGEFLAQVGVPRWDPARDTANLDLFLILFEARLYLGAVSLVPTVFLHPGYYLQNPTGEAGQLDFNFALKIGDRTESLLRGGFESNVAFHEEDLQGLEVKLAPFMSFATAGAVWQLKVNVRVFPSIDFEGFIGVKAGF